MGRQTVRLREKRERGEVRERGQADRVIERRQTDTQK